MGFHSLLPVLCCLAAAFIAVPATAELTVSAPDGRAKILRDDGTWHYRSGPGMEPDTDRSGSDYTDFSPPRPDPLLCRDRCRDEARCRAWTFVRPGAEGALARCRLKHLAPPPRPAGCCISGVKRDGDGAAPSLAAIWRGRRSDVVGRGGMARPNGEPDGHFSVALNTRGAQRTVTGLALQATGEDGTPDGGQVWDTTPNSHWILGVLRGAARLNPNDRPIADAVRGRVVYEIFANDSGRFQDGRAFRITVQFADGTHLTTTARIGQGGGGVSDCRRYTETAVRQVQENLRRGCGFTGVRWQLSERSHLDWCRRARPPARAAEMRARKQALDRCGTVRPRVFQMFRTVRRQSSTIFRAYGQEGLEVETGQGRVTPHLMHRPFSAAVQVGPGQRVFLAGDAGGTTGWSIDNFLLIEIAAKGTSGAFVVGHTAPVRMNGRRLARIGRQSFSFSAGEIDLTRHLPRGASRITVRALDYGGVAFVSDVFLIIR